MPVWIGHSEDESVVFEIKSRTCYSCAEIEGQREAEEKRRSKSNRRPTRGKKRFLARRDEDKPAPSRASYYKAEYDKIVG